MLETKIRIILLIAVICYFVIIMIYLKNKTLNLKYSLLWLFAGLAMGLFVLFPHLLYWFSDLFGIYDPMNTLFAAGIGFLIAIVMSLTSIVSRQNRKIRTLIQELAILEKRVRELEGSKSEK